jgi:hypothetical protein
MIRRRRLGILVAALVVASACESRPIGQRDDLNPTPTPIPAPPVPRRIEYRVTGTIPNTKITYFSSSQGTTNTTTDLPWVLTYTSPADRAVYVFLSAEAPTSNFVEGALVAQIFVDGVLFREARGSGFSPIVTVSGEVSP